MKETQKQQIDRLQRELRKQKELYNNLNAEILEMQNNADNSFVNSGEYKQMSDRLGFLETQNKILEKDNRSLNEKVQNLINEKGSRNNFNNIHKLNNEIIEKHNERGAGRKRKFTEAEKEKIKTNRMQGDTIKEIAIKYKCSVGLVHKLINEKNNNL